MTRFEPPTIEAHPADLDFDPSYRRHRAMARFIIGELLNHMPDEPFSGGRIGDSAGKPGQLRRTMFELAYGEGLVTFDDLHHAPMCPANHYHYQRLPNGPCSCGAARLAGK